MDKKPITDEIRAFHEAATSHCVRVAGEISQRDDRIAKLEDRLAQTTVEANSLRTRLEDANDELARLQVQPPSDAESEAAFDRAICAVASETQRVSGVSAVHLSVEARDKLAKAVDAVARELYLGRSAR